ncbi:PadR family transcriptional regulator [Saccharothrix yanglingensis]|nr:PadR family transcriptional regulator [Saccharothrix yanglingensis]
MTLQTQLVLHVLLGQPETEHYGLDVIRRTGLGPGTVYPIMQRLERDKWVSSRWERVDPSDEARPARRYYRLTGDGVVLAVRALQAAEQRNPALTRMLGLVPESGGPA